MQGKYGRKEKTRILLDSNFILGVYDYSVVLRFSWTSWNIRAPSGKVFEDHHGIFFGKL